MFRARLRLPHKESVMNTATFLKSARKQIKLCAPEFYMAHIHRKNETLLRLAEELDAQTYGCSVKQIDDPYLQLIWAIQKSISQYLLTVKPIKKAGQVTVSEMRSYFDPNLALLLIQNELVRTFFFTALRGITVSPGTVIKMGPDWKIVEVSAKKSTGDQEEQSRYLARSARHIGLGWDLNYNVLFIL